MTMKNKIPNWKFLASAVLLLVLACSFASAIGFSSSFDKEHPLEVYPGETKDTSIGLKSSDSEGNVVIKASMQDNAGIATLTDKTLEYSVSPGISGSKLVNIRVKIPEDTAIGATYLIKIEFIDITPSAKNAGTVSLKTGSLASLPVKVVEKPAEPVETPVPETGSNALWWALVLIVIAAIIIAIYLLLKRKK